jgi:ferredoxin
MAGIVERPPYRTDPATRAHRKGTLMKRNIIVIDEERCDGCGQCISACAEAALAIIDGKAKVVADSYCDGLGACIGTCPRDALRICERDADAFDPEAVSRRQHRPLTPEPPAGSRMLPCGCPSTWEAAVAPARDDRSAGAPAGEASELTHWPVQLRLVPPRAQFLHNADLLIAADCTGFASPGFHRDFLRGRVVLIGCPKFDDQQQYVETCTGIFRTAGIHSVTVLIMDVPCCQSLAAIVRKALRESGAGIPLEIIELSRQGDVLKRTGQAV